VGQSGVGRSTMAGHGTKLPLKAAVVGLWTLAAVSEDFASKVKRRELFDLGMGCMG